VALGQSSSVISSSVFSKNLRKVRYNIQEPKKKGLFSQICEDWSLGTGVVRGRKTENNIHDSIGLYQVKSMKGLIQIRDIKALGTNGTIARINEKGDNIDSEDNIDGEDNIGSVTRMVSNKIKIIVEQFQNILDIEKRLF
jgi:hypothetical protein